MDSDPKNEKNGPRSEITRMHMDPDAAKDSYSLDSRYGKKRSDYNLETAQDMARVDDLIQVAGIVPGDNFELRIKERAPNINKKTGTFERRVWRSAGDRVFVEVDNGRFLVRGAPGSGEESRAWHLISLSMIVGIRKVRPKKK
ncbi:hypothetical protein HY968_02185 [Candidatus Kaiserbacteria bacterium]|nr:hypothetical protein [Candidatus Kaiserbacteria bacterium]